MSKIKKKGWLFVLPWSPDTPGGVSRVVVEMSKVFGQEGIFKPIVLVADWAARRPLETQRSHFKEVRLRLRDLRTDKIIKPMIGYFLALPVTLMVLIKLVRSYDVGVVNIHFPCRWCVSFVLLKKLPRSDFVLLLSVHGADISAIGKRSGLDRLLWQWIFRSADAVIACSKGLAEQTAASFPSAARKVRHIHNGVSREFFDSESGNITPMPLGLPKDNYILSVGTYERNKGFDLLIKAFSNVAGIFPDLSLVLVGRTGASVKECRELALELNVQDRVLLFQNIGPVEIVKFYSRASLFVSASRYESFGIVMLEAGAANLPVVATRTAGAVEIIEHNRDGLLVPVEDAAALAGGIAELLEDKERRKQFSTALHEKVKTSFTWTKAVAEYAAVVDGLPV